MNQRDRFEAAWLAGGFDPEWIARFSRSMDRYDSGADDAFAGFQLGEASGLELAAQVCDAEAAQFAASDYAPSIDSFTAKMFRRLAAQIRALLARGE